MTPWAGGAERLAKSEDCRAKVGQDHCRPSGLAGFHSLRLLVEGAEISLGQKCRVRQGLQDPNMPVLLAIERDRHRTHPLEIALLECRARCCQKSAVRTPAKAMSGRAAASSRKTRCVRMLRAWQGRRRPYAQPHWPLAADGLPVHGSARDAPGELNITKSRTFMADLPATRQQPHFNQTDYGEPQAFELRLGKRNPVRRAGGFVMVKRNALYRSPVDFEPPHDGVWFGSMLPDPCGYHGVRSRKGSLYQLFHLQG